MKLLGDLAEQNSDFEVKGKGMIEIMELYNILVSLIKNYKLICENIIFGALGYYGFWIWSLLVQIN